VTLLGITVSSCVPPQVLYRINSPLLYHKQGSVFATILTGY